MSIIYCLPDKLSKLFAVTAEYYNRKGNVTLRNLMQQSEYEIEEAVGYDNWDGGTYGHAVHFQVPGDIYFEIIDNLTGVAEEIRTQVNKISPVNNEYIHVITIEIHDAHGLGIQGQDAVPGPLATRDRASSDYLWKQQGFLRIFLSHRADYKAKTAELKNLLLDYGVTCFVAHEDITPTREWQDEIEKALFSMDALVALMTDDFHDSLWTDQEIGVAMGRGVPVISVRLGTDPYGFIGKFQGLRGQSVSSVDLAMQIFMLLLQNFSSMRLRIAEALVARFETAKNYAHSKQLMGYLEQIQSLEPDLIQRLEVAPSNNRQVRESSAVIERLPVLIKRLKGIGV